MGQCWALSIALDATIDADLRHIHGQLIVQEDAEVDWIDPLALLPMPQNDLDAYRLFPGRPEQGFVHWTRTNNVLSFETYLPARFGDIGSLPHRGLMANGGWYPQAVDAQGLLVNAQWTATLHLPPDGVGILNGQLASDRLSAQCDCDRLALAVLPHANIQRLSTSAGDFTLVTAQKDEPRLNRWLQSIPELAGLTVIEDLDFIQLATAAPGMVYLSDRAGRLSLGLKTLHVPSLRRRALEAASDLPDAWWRNFVATAQADQVAAPSLKKMLGWLSWNPVIDALLSDGTLPYYGDMFNESHLPPSGVSIIEPHLLSGQAAYRQLQALGGTWDVTQLLENPQAALLAAGVPTALLDGWKQIYDKNQNYDVTVEGQQVVLQREAPPLQPPEVVEITMDGQSLSPWLTTTGSDRLVLPLSNKHPEIRLDPQSLTEQATTVDDRWPAHWHPVLSGGAYNISLTSLNADLFGETWVRKEGDTHHIYYLALSHDQQDMIAIVPGYIYSFGPLLDRRRRAHRLSWSASTSLLDAGFRPTDTGQIAVGTSLRYAWDTRDEVHGHRYGVGVGAGFVPGSTEHWSSASGSVIQYIPFHPYHMLALRLTTGVASGQVEHRLLPLGGGGALRSLPEDLVVGNVLLCGNLEYRATLLHHLSVPLGIGWLSDVQLVPGVEAGQLWRTDATVGKSYAATGFSLGGFVVVDLLGADPTLVGLTLARPLVLSHIATEGFQVYAEFEHPF